MKKIEKKIICELLVKDKAKLIVYSDKDYDKCYFDSWLYFFDGKKEYELINESFAFTIGMGLYKRLFDLNEYNGDDFENELKNHNNSDFYEKISQKFELSECKNYELYLFKDKGKMKFLLYNVKIISREKKGIIYKYKKFYETEISADSLIQWRNILEREYLPRYIQELKKSIKNISKEQILTAVNSLKNNQN